MIKQLLRNIRDCCYLLQGGLVYLFTNKTPANGYQSLVRLFCTSSGRVNDLATKMIRLYNRPFRKMKAQGVLGKLSCEAEDEINRELQDKGYYVFDKRLPLELCQALYAFAKNEKCVLTPQDGQDENNIVLDFYNPDNVKATQYVIPLEVLIENTLVQDLMGDQMFIKIAQNYIGSKPYLDQISLKWNTPLKKGADSNAAQLYHFDMDRLKWLKIFIYLTDVTEENGPHVFVEGTHKSSNIPEKLLRKGYARHTDKEVFEQLPLERKKVFTGQAGTIIIEDTRGLHKGEPLRHKERLMFELQFSNSLFGATLTKKVLNSISSIRLRDTISSYKDIYKYYSGSHRH